LLGIPMNFTQVMSGSIQHIIQTMHAWFRTDVQQPLTV